MELSTACEINNPFQQDVTGLITSFPHTLKTKKAQQMSFLIV